jgi:hypothetical protein
MEMVGFRDLEKMTEQSENYRDRHAAPVKYRKNKHFAILNQREEKFKSSPGWHLGPAKTIQRDLFQICLA